MANDDNVINIDKLLRNPFQRSKEFFQSPEWKMMNQHSKLRAMASTLVARSQLMARLGKAYGTKRDLYEALGYRKVLTFDDYYARYDRQDIASRIVNAPVKATWRDLPEVLEDDDPSSETAFEKAWNVLVKEKKIFKYLRRVDEISGVGEYGVLVIGFDDGQPDLRQPVQSARGLNFLQAYMQNNADIDTWVKDVRDERFGLPETYTIQFATADKSDSTSKPVHWSRILHVAEGLTENEVYGTPRLKKVFNRLQDLEHLAGGSSEMFWRGAFPGMAFMNEADASFDPGSMADLEDEIDEYLHELKRYMRLNNLKVEQLAPQVADPSNHVEIQLMLISATTEIPKRILTGSERGELSSTQDKENWADKIQERRITYAGPCIVEPLVERLINVGVLPEPKQFEVKWPDAHVQSDMERADVNKKKIETLAAYANSPNAVFVVPPDMFLTKFLDFDQQDIDDANKALNDMDLLEKKQIDEDKAAAAEEARMQRTRPPAQQEFGG